VKEVVVSLDLYDFILQSNLLSYDLVGNRIDLNKITFHLVYEYEYLLSLSNDQFYLVKSKFIKF
jgi:hypothetical protein